MARGAKSIFTMGATMGGQPLGTPGYMCPKVIGRLAREHSHMRITIDFIFHVGSIKPAASSEKSRRPFPSAS